MNRIYHQARAVTIISRRVSHSPSQPSIVTSPAALKSTIQIPPTRPYTTKNSFTRNIAMETIATLKRISADQLAVMLREEHKQGIKAGGDESKIAIVDVRDDDYLGGHISGSLNCPSRVLDTWMPTLLRKFADKEVVIFHCMLSQQRGPSAALRYAREKEITDASNKRNGDDVGGEGGKKQALYVLDLGFQGWQEKFGEDEVLTEGYRKELWEDY